MAKFLKKVKKAVAETADEIGDSISGKIENFKTNEGILVETFKESKSKSVADQINERMIELLEDLDSVVIETSFVIGDSVTIVFRIKG